MKKFLKPGKVVVMLTGRHAGRKAVILKVYYEGTKTRKFGHCLVAGLQRYPRKVTRTMSTQKANRRMKLKPFIQYVNFNHFMPTRYQVSSLLKIQTLEKAFDERLQVKSGVDVKTRDPLNNADFKSDFLKRIGNQFSEQFKKLDLNDNSKENIIAKFLFKPLRF